MDHDEGQLEYCNCIFGWDGTYPLYEANYESCIDNIPIQACELGGGICLNMPCIPAPHRGLVKSNKERQDFWEDYINKN